LFDLYILYRDSFFTKGWWG